MDLCKLEDLKQYMEGMTETDDYDHILGLIITGTSKRFEIFCNRIFDNNNGADITEYFSGRDNMSSVVVERYPIVSITSIHDDIGRNYGSDTLYQSSEYTFMANEGRIQLDYISFTNGNNNIRVIYKGGYASNAIPKDLELACIMQSAVTFNRRQHQGLSGVAGTAGSLSIFDYKDFLPEVKNILQQYKRITI